MNLAESKISNFQLMFLITGFIQGSVLLTTFLDPITKHDTWLVTITGFLISIPFVWSYVALAQMFPGKDLVQINDNIYGSFGGKIVSILYFCFFLMLLSLNLRILSNFYIGFIMPEAPMIFFLTIFTLVCAYAVHNGIETIARTSFAIIIVSFAIIAATIFLLINEMNFSNFLPVFELPLNVFFQGAHIVAIIPFCEILVFLMVMPSSNNIKHVLKFTFMGLTLSAMFLLAVTVRNTAVLGVLTTIVSSSSYQAARLINIGDFLTRVEVFISIGITITLFIKISTIYYASVSSLSQILRLRSYRPLILPIGSIAICLAIIIFDSTVDHSFEGTNYYAIYATPFEFILPPLSLLIAKVRRTGLITKPVVPEKDQNIL